MPRIPDEMLDTAVYLYATPAHARDGVNSGGSGFAIGVYAPLPDPLNPPPPSHEPASTDEARDNTKLSGRWFCYAVSNRHVIDEFPVVRINTRDGKTDILPLRTEDWEPHPTSDLAVALFEYKVGIHKSLLIDVAMILTAGELEALDVGIGDDVNMVGRFINHDGEQTNRPTVRFGNISMVPGSPIKVETSEDPQDVYLIETRTIPGYSGSPVFLDVPTWELLANAPESARRRIGEDNRHVNRLLGIVGGWLAGRDHEIFVNGRKVETFAASSNSGMMWCIPAHHLLYLLNLPKLQAQRKALRDKWRQQGAPAKPA